MLAEILKKHGRKSGEFKGLNEYEKKDGLLEANQVGFFFEGIGILLHRKLVDIGLVDDLFTGPIKDTWAKK